MQLRETKKDKMRVVPYAVLPVLFLVPVVMAVASSMYPAKASAANNDRVDVNVQVKNTLSITTDPTVVNFEMAPSNAGMFDSQYSNVVVDTSNATGYTLSMVAANGDMASKDGYTDEISNLSLTGALVDTGLSETAFSAAGGTDYNNQWGVAINNDGVGNISSASPFHPTTSTETDVPDNYYALPTGTSKTIAETTVASTVSTTKATFGVRVNNDIKAGTYGDTVTFTAVANYVPTIKTLADITTMQEMTPEVCDATATPVADGTLTIYYLQDVRGGGYDNSSTGAGAAAPLNTDTSGNKTYAVAKLADGKCWMLQNLNLAGATITAADSDFTGSDITIPNSVSGFYNDTDTLKAYYVGDTDADRSRHIGAYYNWYTATATSGTSSTAADVEATSSICPAGWQLPKAGTTAGDSSNYFYNVLNRYTISGRGSWNSGTNGYWSGDARNGLANAPLYLPTAGYVYNGSVYDKADRGFYWSSMAGSAGSTSAAHFLDFYSGSTYPRDNGGKFGGYSVRCVHKDTRTIDNISYMQDMNSTICANTEAGVIKYLQDKRGGGYDNSSTGTGAAEPLNTDTSGTNTYAVAKLNDGKCWMLQNLNIVDTTITAADSDFTGEDITLPNTLTNFDGSHTDNLNAYYVGDTDADRSRHIGAYYNWYTATAKSGTSSTAANVEATSSICPAGWHLPKAGTTVYSGNYFYDVLSRYTISGKGSWNSTYNYWSGDARNGLAGAPLYLPSAGLVRSGSVDNKADDGHYWSSMANSTSYAYSLYFANNTTDPRYNYNKYDGFSVRCVTE